MQRPWHPAVRKSKRLLRLLPLVATLVVMSGCATSALWEEGRFAQFREPAASPNLRVFQSHRGDDVLVCYNEVREDGLAMRSRAYWLGANHEPVENPHKPRFVSTRQPDGLVAVPIFSGVPSNAPPAGLYAIATTTCAFALHSGEICLGNYELPVYEKSSGRVKQVLLTPFAFAADLTIVGGYLFLLAWSEGGLPEIH